MLLIKKPLKTVFATHLVLIWISANSLVKIKLRILLKVKSLAIALQTVKELNVLSASANLTAQQIVITKISWIKTLAEGLKKLTDS